MLALAIRLVLETCDESSRNMLRRKLNRIFPPQFWHNLYSTVIRHGQIWNITDPLLALRLVNGLDGVFSIISEGDTTISGVIGNLVTQWFAAVPSDDVVTVSALLDLLMALLTECDCYNDSRHSISEEILGQSTRLVQTLVRRDQSLLKTRPYLRWILATARHAHDKASRDVDTFVEYLKRQGGDVSYPSPFSLPQYIPNGQENPGWQLPDAGSEFTSPIKLVVRMARDLGDCKTEALSLQQLILYSRNPTNEFAELCQLQRSTGNLAGYVNTLISRYLVSVTEESRRELQIALSDQLVVGGISNSLDEDTNWKAHELLNSLQAPIPNGRLALRVDRGPEEAPFAQYHGDTWVGST